MTINLFVDKVMTLCSHLHIFLEIIFQHKGFIAEVFIDILDFTWAFKSKLIR